jgi:hypothetical protein
MFWRKPRPGIFRYYDGHRWRDGDPIRIQRDIEVHGGEDWPRLIEGLDQLEDPPGKFSLSENIQAARRAVGMESVYKVAELCRQVFGIKQLDDGGLTDAECVQVFTGYLRYTTHIARKHRSFRNPPPLTASVDGG